MLKKMLMSFPVVVQSVKVAKDENHNNYGNFLFTGGALSVPVDPGTIAALKEIQGSEIIAVFEMKPVSIVRFNRAVCVFEPVRFVSQEHKSE